MQDVQKFGLWHLFNSHEDSPNNTAINNVLNAYPEIKLKLGLKS